MEKAYRVRAAHCDHRVSSEEVYQALRRITDPLERSWARLEKARKIALKFNMMFHGGQVAYFAGRRRELVDDAVCVAVLRLLRERTTARLVATDTFGYDPEGRITEQFNYLPLLEQFGVEFVDSNRPPFATYEVPGGGRMFGRYTLSACFADADEVVSIAKMKNHHFMGVTLCMKNLFGLTPAVPPLGRVRTYYHHAIRLSYVLPDLAMITNPCLNIIDALVGQYGCEWGGEGRIGDALIAGDQITATDACAAHLMGHDPASDWPTPPFRRDRNHLLLAAQGGFGTVDLNEIDFESEVKGPLADFDSVEYDPPAVMATCRQTACEQGLFYRDRQRAMIDQYRGEFIYMQDGEVVWHGPDPSHIQSHRQFSGKKPGSALWLKYVDAEEREQERFAAYEECLARMRA
ncbi:MAG: DUF362 domain-containing protein [Candidatus Latescibacteria bacterium]|nr:DUF362 domain-containing protein [Candidatus Latescibacterota bacterium]